jgi:peptide/nickel transport system substrate-binding protein
MAQLIRFHRGAAIALAVLLMLGLIPSAFLTTTIAAPIGEPSTETPNDGGTWTIGVADEPDTLDPHKTASARANLIMRQVCDPLIAQDFDGNYVPGLASSWTISDDGLHWTFQLRRDVTFQDGTPFNAAAVKFSFDRILDPATASASAISLLGPMVSTSVDADYTFSVNLSQPFAPLLDNLAHAGLLCIVSPTAVAAEGADFGRKPVSTGPYLISEWRAGDRITMTRNPNYRWAPGYLHQDGPAHIETIVWRIIVEEAARVAAFEAGEIDQIDVPALEVSRIRESGQYTTIDYLNPGVTFFEFNVTQPPFDDIRVRQAFNYAINTQEILDAAIEGNGELAHGFLPPSIWGYWPGIVDYAPKYDPEHAKALLAEAGWTDSDGDGTLDKGGQPLSVTIDTATFDSWQRATQVAQAQLADIGVELKIETFEFGTLLNNLKAGNHQMEMMGYIYTEPDIAYIWFDSANAGTGVNYSHINDPHLDDLIAQGRSTLDPEARAKVYEEIQKYIVDLALWVPLWVDSVTIAFSPRLHNAQLHPDAYVVYYDAWVD